jgi:hypothetical protein
MLGARQTTAPPKRFGGGILSNVGRKVFFLARSDAHHLDRVLPITAAVRFRPLGALGIGITTLGELLLQIGQHLLNLGFSISSCSDWEFADNVAVLIRNHGYERKIVIGTLHHLAEVFGHESLLAYR